MSRADGPHGSGADSAGRPWAGRAFEAAPSAFAGDDGGAPDAYVAALASFRAGRTGREAVVDALRTVRLLVPLVAGLAEADEVDGRRVEKRAELALPTVAGPDGRRVLPAFSSAAAMRAWDPAARPIPAPARQVALGAAGDGTELVVIDAATDRFGLRRSAVEALARDVPWRAPEEDPAVVAALRAGAAEEPDVRRVALGTGDPGASLDGPEVRVVLVLARPLDAAALQALAGRVQARWSAAEAVRRSVDSLSLGFADA